MKRISVAAAVTVALLLFAIGLLVTLPCVTHRLYVVNLTENVAGFQVGIGNVTVWSDTLRARQRVSVPIVSDVSRSSLNVHVDTKGKPPQSYSIENAYYLIGHPHETDVYVIVLTSKGIEIFPMEHPFISIVDTKCWKETSQLAFVFINLLSCADNARVPFRL
jgi:hypothetical protein